MKFFQKFIRFCSRTLPLDWFDYKSLFQSVSCFDFSQYNVRQSVQGDIYCSILPSRNGFLNNVKNNSKLVENGFPKRATYNMVFYTLISISMSVEFGSPPEEIKLLLRIANSAP